MQTIALPNTSLCSSRFAYGCMRLIGDGTSSDKQKGIRALESALDLGFNHFDHADIYANGECESLFGEMLRASPSLRQSIIITTKAGIRFASEDGQTPKRYDFSKEHICASVEASLGRLCTDNIDIFMLHRPDYLMDIQEVAESFSRLLREGKVSYFAVSNFTYSQVEMLRSALDFPIIAHQMEINIDNLECLDNGTLDQCQQHSMIPMAWCPLGGVAYSAWNQYLDSESLNRVIQELNAQSDRYNCDVTQLCLAFLLQHPSNILPIIGSVTPDRLKLAVESLQINYTREDWYRILQARNGQELP